MVDVSIRRRYVNDDYFGKSKGGYTTTANNTPPANTMPYFHQEKDRLTDLDNSADDHTITVEFGKAFTEIPIMETFEVYRMAPYSGGYRRKDVLFVFATNPFPALDGFEIEIHETEDLTGVIIEYLFIEQ